VADRAEPFVSRGRAGLAERTAELEQLALQMYARGLSTRDIEAAFRDASGASLLSRTAVSEVTERLWQEYEAFAGRDLSEVAVAYSSSTGWRSGSTPAWRARRAVRLRHHRGRAEGPAAPGPGHQGRHRELHGVFRGPEATRPGRIRCWS